METRRILVANTKTQQRHEINTNATTLGELKAAMNEAGIDYYGMDFTEGISKTQLLSDDSLLPSNVVYKGTPTNNLVMLLTNTTKNIASGCGERSRKEAYAYIKDWGTEVMDRIKAEYGRNYTQVPTDDLWAVIDSLMIRVKANGTFEVGTAEEHAAKIKAESKPEFKLPDVKTAPHPEAVEWYYMGIKAMIKSGLLYVDDVAVIADLATDLYKRLKEEQPKITDKDIDNMIESL